MVTLETLNFDNSFSRLPDVFYSAVKPQPLKGARLVHFSPDAARLIDLPEAELLRPAFVDYLNGENPLPGAYPLSQVYAGHQFGHYVPQLGDGRAILLGEVINQQGERWDLQLKGAGLTPYSRMGDGRAVLRSTIREYLCSEAMAGLGIPTTRALCLLHSEEPVWREQLETAALLLRLSPTHIRFGHFEFFCHSGQHEALRQLTDYVIKTHFPALEGNDTPYLALFRWVVEKTAVLMADWMAIGWTHGVMNTDNMSILGLTIDYGPYAFMDEYHPDFIPNHSDTEGRYAYKMQPWIGQWNLGRLAAALTPLVPVEALKEALGGYEKIYWEAYTIKMLAKLGLSQATSGVTELITSLLTILHEHRVDYTVFFRQLCHFQPGGMNAAITSLFQDPARIDGWLADYTRVLEESGEPIGQAQARMKRVNPKYILRNHMAQQAIEQAEQGSFKEVERLHQLLQTPFDEQPGCESYAEPSPDWAKRIVISCSS
ncbi:MAG TPA: YdiU family protein [Gammaproteobacteria bacterium]|nr:YdiU family protein [Gammaproteobacteria bacterium]